MTTRADHAAHLYVGAFVDELARAGVHHVCVAPGSRSTPLALMIAEHPALRTWIHLDERSAAFFALGMARALAEPVALLCTSGSATANFFPAVVEARHACVPLLVLTADRPPELRDTGAAQTIDQNRLYGTHAKWFVDVALPDTTPELLRYVRTLAGRAAACALEAPAGPVHLNFPFREPLVPRPAPAPSSAALSPVDALAVHGRPDGAPWVAVREGLGRLDAASVRRLARQLREAQRPLLVCGPQYDAALAAPLAALARALDAPLLVDPLSQLRWGTHDRSTLIDRYDAALRHEPTSSALAPDLVLRFGAVPTSKPLAQYLQRHGAARSIVVDASRWSDPSLLAAEVVHADPALLCRDLLDALQLDESDGGASSGDWLGAWRRVDATAATALARWMASLDEPFEGRVLAAAVEALPEEGTLFVSSSMPVRDLDAFAAGDGRRLRILANRGANGIDGVVSTALGAAAASREQGGGPLVLVIGDIAFYHDLNGLLAAKLHALDATVVVLNNDGGGIFSFLPQAGEPAHFERMFGTPHGLEFAPAAALYDASHRRVEKVSELRAGIAAGIAGDGLHIVELCTERTRNVLLHQQAWTAVVAALDGADAMEPARGEDVHAR